MDNSGLQLLLEDGTSEAPGAGAASPGLTLKGLRHTVATILAEMGMDDRTIADMLGQRTF